MNNLYLLGILLIVGIVCYLVYLEIKKLYIQIDSQNDKISELSRIKQNNHNNYNNYNNYIDHNQEPTKLEVNKNNLDNIEKKKYY